MNLPVEGAFHNLVLVSIKKQYPFHAAPPRARPLGLGADVVLEGHLRRSTRTSTCRTSGRSRGGCSPTSTRSATSRSSTARSTSSTTAPTRRSGASKVCIDGTRKWTRGGVHARVARAVPHERGGRRARRRDVGGARDRRRARERRHADGATGPIGTRAAHRARRRGSCDARARARSREADRERARSPTCARAGAPRSAHASRGARACSSASLRPTTPSTASCPPGSIGAGGRGPSREVRRAPAGPVLDLCAGTMDLDRAARARTCRATASSRVDFSAQMLEAGRAQGATRGDRRRRRDRAAVRRRRRSPPSSAASGCATSPTRRAARARCCACCAPGGVFVTLELFRPTRMATRAFHRAYAQVVLPARRRHRLGRPRRLPVSRARAWRASSRAKSTSARLAEVGFGERSRLRPHPRRRVHRRAAAGALGRPEAKKIVVGITGASGAPYARRLVALLRAARRRRDRRVRLADRAGGLGARVRRRPARVDRRADLGRARLQGALRQRQRRLARDGGRPVLDGDRGAHRARDLATRSSRGPPT